MFRRVVTSERQRGGPRRLRAVGAGVALVVAGSVLGPPVASAAQSVFINNTASNPVPTRPVGTTAVDGTVALADGTTVTLADGTSVSLEPGAVVSLADNTVRLADGSALRLADGSTVALATGSVVALADGSRVTLDAPVQLAPGSVVALAGGSAVTIDNDPANPVPVTVVDEAVSAREHVSFRSDMVALVGDPNGRGPGYTVPAGKRLVVTLVTGFVEGDVERVGFDLRSAACYAQGSGDYLYGTITGTDPGAVWSLQGEPSFGPGCTIVPFLSHSPTATSASSASAHLFGYLIPAA